MIDRRSGIIPRRRISAACGTRPRIGCPFARGRRIQARRMSATFSFGTLTTFFGNVEKRLRGVHLAHLLAAAGSAAQDDPRRRKCGIGDGLSVLLAPVVAVDGVPLIIGSGLRDNVLVAHPLGVYGFFGVHCVDSCPLGRPRATGLEVSSSIQRTRRTRSAACTSRSRRTQSSSTSFRAEQMRPRCSGSLSGIPTLGHPKNPRKNRRRRPRPRRFRSQPAPIRTNPGRRRRSLSFACLHLAEDP
jgi:hypothetical protein